MTYAELQAHAKALYEPILLLEDVYPYERRRSASQWLTLVCLLLLCLSFVTFMFGRPAVLSAMPQVAGVADWSLKLFGLFFIVLVVRFFYTALEAFHRSYYYRGLNLLLGESDSDNEVRVSFEVAAILHYTDPSDVTKGFLQSPYGEDILLRLGITEAEIADFLTGRRTPLPAERCIFDQDPQGTNLVTFSRNLLKLDEEFRAWLFARAITNEVFEGAADWVMRSNRWLRNKERWYSRDMLGRIEGIGKSFSFGERFTLEKFGHYMMSDPVYQVAEYRRLDEDSDVEAIEAQLVRTREANALLVARDKSTAKDILAQLAHKIHEGLVLPPIEHKHLFLFDLRGMIGTTKDKATFEETFHKALREASMAGDVILVVEDVGLCIEDAATLGSDLVGLCEPYFDAAELQLIFVTDENLLHRALEKDSRLMQNFELVRLHDIDNSMLLRILAQRALRLERRYPIIVTYQGLLGVLNDAVRYFPDAVMPDKGLDLLEEAILAAAGSGEEFLTEAVVNQVVEGKTGIPLGEVSESEGEKLMHLEEELRERVIGQEDAIAIIAGTMRRARAGINDPDRPIGTFLFLGPTGVGKTETAKALAHSFFGSDDAMHRLDMSEYTTADAINRLIGFTDGAPGRLVTMLKEAPYRVVLLDEFEKASQQVHDLFLQILDEGEFADVDGNKVNARNTIMIATSNAGADILYHALEEGANIGDLHDEIVDEIVERGIFRPELLNRFDGVILFHPLVQNEAEQIARLALGDLHERLLTKGLDLAVTDELVAYVSEHGYDPRFGGRNINRFIKEHVEQKIADKIIAGQVKKGETIVLTSRDLT